MVWFDDNYKFSRGFLCAIFFNLYIMSNQTNNSNNMNNSSVIAIPNLSKKERLIINIITDSVVFTRISCAMQDIVTCFHPGHGKNSFDVDFEGIENAFVVMDLEDRDLCDELHDRYSEFAYDMKETRKANEVALSIYFDWLTFIKDYYTSKKAS